VVAVSAVEQRPTTSASHHAADAVRSTSPTTLRKAATVAKL
jgi:hypothetical protein